MPHDVRESARWEVAIDVGGTFTDCLARAPNGTLRRLKILSSGITKGRVGEGSSHDAIIDDARRHDPPGFWIGARLALINNNGAEIESTDVIDFNPTTGRLRLRDLTATPAPNSAYELRCDFDAPVIAIRRLLALPLSAPIPPLALRLGTTRGTNALITRTGARTALATTRGFGDVLEIGYQARPRLFDLAIHKPRPITTAVVEINERVTHDGQILAAPIESVVRQQLQSLHEAGIESLAICLLHADRHPTHEQIVARIAREVGFREVSVSHEVAPLPKIVARADTTVVDAYLNPVLREYVARLQAALPGSQIRLLTSAGGLVAAEQFRGKDSILSGPAGGVVGFSRVAQATGFARAIGFDMGGTSTDVSRFDGRFELEFETQKAGVRLVAPTMAIETVAAGGGSICRFDGVKLVVGPESAGALPGPACYDRSGPLTVTDCNLYLGRLIAERFPFPLNRAAAEKRLTELASTVAQAGGFKLELDELAVGLLRIANANMAAAIRLVTVSKGANPTDYVLVAFGSASPQHACAVAAELGIENVLIHSDAGILSAAGISLADVARHHSLGVERLLTSESITDVRQLLDTLEREAVAEVENEGIATAKIAAVRSLDLRYQGVESHLAIVWPPDNDFTSAFAAEHQKRYGYSHNERRLEIVAARVVAVGQTAASPTPTTQALPKKPKLTSITRAYFAGKPIDVPLFDRIKLLPGDQIPGPAVIVDDLSTTIVEPNWQADVLTAGELLLTADKSSPESIASPICNQNSKIKNPPDPVFLEVFNNLLATTAEQMGVTLRNTASSVNVKERLDFSCAIFTPDGRLVANAPHVPVHLGAMEETVRSTIRANPTIEPGDVFATNDPYAGGSHLPDITVVAPVHNAVGKLLFFTANRAHHAEIGGITPGSMPPLSKNLAEEGVLIRNLRIVAAGKSRFDELRGLLAAGPHPSRDIATNLADVAAQVAANRQGAIDLLALVDRYTEPVVDDYMEHVQTAAAQKLRQALSKISCGRHTFTDYLETADGASLPINVAFTIHDADHKPAATIDFTGTGTAVNGNLNANPAIVTAAVIYVLRLLAGGDIPLNHGVLEPIELIIPECLLNPRAGESSETTPAVAGGNVETSQRVVDVLLGALGLAGASQGTMNNVLFGDAAFGYYETICGGSGATADSPGASAVQVHMTNTRSTDPEILERRFPVRIQEFSIRRGSGGAGRQRGGDGTIRRLEFLRPLTLSLLTQRRGPHPPYGMAGGKPGALGRHQLIHPDSRTENLPGIAQLNVSPGDVLVIETPGGGGFGS